MRQPVISRRSLMLQMAAASAASISTPSFGKKKAGTCPPSGHEYSTRAVNLVKNSFPIDMKHALSLNPKVLRTWLTRPRAFGEAEWACFRASGLKVIQTTLETVDDTLLDYAWHNGFLAVHSDYFMRINNPEDFDTLMNSEKIGIILGSENSTHFRTVDDVNLYYGLGQRVSQLTYNKQNLLGAGATERVDGGLSDYGMAVLKRMNQVGMAVDVSHCGDRTTLDALEATTEPALITHATTRALNPSHPRAKTDEAIRKLAKTGGVMGIAFLRIFVRDHEPTTIEHVLDHFDHVANLVGVEHVAIGSDIALTGYDSLPPEMVAASKATLKPGTYNFRERNDIDGLDHPRRLFDLTEGLIRRGYSSRDISLIIGGNARRVFSTIMRAGKARKKQNSGA